MKTTLLRLSLALLACTASAPTLAAGEAHSAAPNARLERALSWGLDRIDADRAYRQVGAGSGVTVALIDTGIASGAHAFFANISPASIDLLPHRAFGDAGAGHGGQTAGLLAAARDGRGTMGVAYDATLLMVRADLDGSCQTICRMHGGDVARGIDYAVAQGARVIGLPIASVRPLRSIEPALERAVAAGVLIVAAAGNDGAEEPVWPARYAADPRFKGSIIVAGAGTLRGDLARWSNRAGSTASHFIVAPGEFLPIDCGQETCSLGSGTSYSVSFVEGAAALLLGRYPDLTGSEVAELLLDAASERRVRADRGRGLLDVRAAVRRLEQAKG
ncbi:S8 family peptidase [Sphingomonas sp. ID0503]|uniref:S8 family peptidase n=1 Tax=Sphingomonas sp. ID0503 TaxID=3399691 RepID=UPI003AFA489E